VDPNRQAHPHGDIEALAALRDPLRRRLYDYVRERGVGVGRDEAAATVGIGRTLAAYHLDKLADEGLLEVDYRRQAGRGGPGAGRPAKLYTVAERELRVSVPARDYALVARLLAEAVEADPTGRTSTALDEAATRVGRETVVPRPASAPVWDTLLDTLRRHGYEPVEDAGAIRLRNCPFHEVARDHRSAVCGMNLALLEGVLAGLDAGGLRAVLTPEPGWCCVRIQPADEPTTCDGRDDDEPGRRASKPSATGEPMP